MNISVIIPALNEQDSIGRVLADIPADLTREVIVIDNGSTDRTAEVAAAKGARVFSEKRRGYGHACLKGMEMLDHPDVVVFLDADYSDHPEEMRNLVRPIIANEADLVIGSRVLGNREKDALPVHAQFGNRLAGAMIQIFFGFRYTDLGPFRAIRYTSLLQLEMVDRTWGWTVEMQIKAIRQRLRIREIPVSYRKRIGQSKISGSLLGSVKAGSKIIWTILKYRFA